MHTYILKNNCMLNKTLKKKIITLKLIKNYHCVNNKLRHFLIIQLFIYGFSN